ncbi:hypothetical protein AB1N83_013110 [Pleurotus pulmonarius]
MCIIHQFPYLLLGASLHTFCPLEAALLVRHWSIIRFLVHNCMPLSSPRLARPPDYIAPLEASIPMWHVRITSFRDDTDDPLLHQIVGRDRPRAIERRRALRKSLMWNIVYMLYMSCL